MTSKDDGITQIYVYHILRSGDESRRGMYIQMEPGTVFMLIRRSIKENHLALVPEMISIDVGETTFALVLFVRPTSLGPTP